MSKVAMERGKLQVSIVLMQHVTVFLWDAYPTRNMRPDLSVNSHKNQTRRAYYHMQAFGDNEYWWKNYNKKYGVFQQKRGELC